MPSITRRSHGTRAQRRDELRDRLLRAVDKLLADGHSYTELSVERLVQEAGVSRSTFYVYFEDKGDLLRAWFAQIIEELTGAAEGWWALGPDVTRERLRDALATIVRTYRPHTALMAAVYDASTYDASVREEVAGMMDVNIAGLRKHIRAGQKAGWVADNLPAAETAAWLTWMAERGFHVMLRSAGDAEVDPLIDAYVDVIWHALYAPAQAA